MTYIWLSPTNSNRPFSAWAEARRRRAEPGDWGGAARSRAHFRARPWFVDLGLPLERFLLHTARQQHTKVTNGEEHLVIYQVGPQRGLAHARGAHETRALLAGGDLCEGGREAPGDVAHHQDGWDGELFLGRGSRKYAGISDGAYEIKCGDTEARDGAEARGAKSLVFDSLEVTLERDERFEEDKEDKDEDEAVDVVEFTLDIDERRQRQRDGMREGADSMDARAIARVAQPSGSSRSDKALVAMSNIAVSNIVVSNMATVRLSAERLGGASDSEIECSDGADGATAV
ncbi:hypothetical protein B0H17DRAFT_1133715 [Mycena rosella]|uniref:Uncharacterized protein n=1 Tax=Mycena rosella TaxID=1033263 RepID=A0AAD7GJW6_MYCRO|nr:hypothetical protein B0H17DRAFT_1133715 [Mycena rosella]